MTLKAEIGYKVIEFFYMTDEYSREFSKVRQKYSLEDRRNDGKRRGNNPNRMCDAEIMVILILFPALSSYSRFVELEKEVALCRTMTDVIFILTHSVK